MSVTFRDDDVLYYPGVGNEVGTNYVEKFFKTHELFEKYKVKHVVAILASGICNNRELVTYIKAHPLIDIQLHGWEHIDYTQNHDKAERHFAESIDLIKSTFSKSPTVWYPPWNKTDDFLKNICKKLGMEVSYIKVSTNNFVTYPENNVTINFHYWAKCDTDYLEECLKIYKERYE